MIQPIARDHISSVLDQIKDKELVKFYQELAKPLTANNHQYSVVSRAFYLPEVRTKNVWPDWTKRYPLLYNNHHATRAGAKHILGYLNMAYEQEKGN